MFPAYGSSNPWRSRSQPPPVQRRPGRGPPQPPPSAAASSSQHEPRGKPAQQQQHSSANDNQQEGEEQGQPESAAVDERTQRLQELDRLAARFQELERKFSPPAASQLVFQPKASPTAPKLEYNSTNAPVHGYEEGLTRLLTELDGVESGGDVQVRTTRKALASRVEGEAQRVEKWRREVFEAKRAGRPGPDWRRADTSANDAKASPTAETQNSARPSESATPDSRQGRPEEASATEMDADEPETPVDEVVYHARDAGGKASSHPKAEHARRPRPSEPTTGSSARGETGSPQQQQQQQQGRTQRGPIPMCRAEDGDEEDMLTSADERDLHAGGPRQQPSLQARGRPACNAPPQANPHGPPPHQQGGRSPTHPSARQAPVNPPQHAAPARRAPLDPFEALFGGGLGRSAAPSSRREVPSSYATYPDRGSVAAGEGEGEGEEEGEGAGRVVYDDDGIPYLFDPRSGSWVPQTQQSRVPWYGHGYPRERDLGGRSYQDPRRSSAYGAPQQQSRRGGGYLTPESDYLFGRGPLGGWGW
ncbi:hypothetical protein JCM3774_003407 [Rhodotorula dairenensis]